MRVLLIDDHALFRFGLKELLERRQIEVVEAVGEGAQGMYLALKLKLDVILLDLRLPDVNGLEILQFFQEQKLKTPVVILTTSDDEMDLLSSLRLGARGYLLKGMVPDELVVALNQVIAGQTIVAKELTNILAKAVQGSHPAHAVDEEGIALADLTPRECEILCHIAEGHSNKVIAAKLGISDGTVKLHVKAILRKLKVHSRVEAAVMAVEEGFCQK